MGVSVVFCVCEGVRCAFSVYVCVFLTIVISKIFEKLIKAFSEYVCVFLAIVISKIFEKLIKARIEDKLKEINLLQAGSRTNRTS